MIQQSRSICRRAVLKRSRQSACASGIMGRVFFYTLFLALTSFSVSAEMRKPNIIFILTDDQRWDALGYAGNPLVHTPEIDRLAAAGTYFKQAFSSTPICAASRASLLSGRYERTHLYNFQTDKIREEFMTDAYPRLLKNAGYQTVFFGKVGVNYDHFERMFDVFDSYDRNNAYTDRRGYFYKKLGDDTVHLTRFTGQQAIDFIDKASTDRPFCMQLSFSAPHAHDGAPDQYFWQSVTDYLLQDANIPPTIFSADSFFNELPPRVKSGFNRLRWTWRFDTPEKYQKSVKGYYRMISDIDLEIAKIRASLQKRGLDRNTVIIFMSDNGYFLGERQLAGKWLMYEPSIRVPLIIMDPRNSNHRDVDAMVMNIDIPATILDFAGIKRPPTWHGASLKPIVDGNTKTLNRDTVMIEHLWGFDEIPSSEGLRTTSWKYFRYVNEKALEYLYDLKNDPQETHNLVGHAAYLAKTDSFRRSLEGHIHRFRDPYSGVPSGLSMNFSSLVQESYILGEQPVFSWVVPEMAQKQKAFQILVSSSKQGAALDNGDIWDSRQIKSDQSNNIVYRGIPLKKGHSYFWKVRIWDSRNRTSAYSEAQSFRIAAQETSF